MLDAARSQNALLRETGQAGAEARETPAGAPPPTFAVTHRPAGEDPVTVKRPDRAAGPVVFASPHAGRNYAPELLARSALPLSVLRWSEDAFIDDLFAAAPEAGAPLVCAEFPRVFLDPNRGAMELDPGMFSDRVPEHDQLGSRRARSGLGVVPRISADGRPIYPGRLRYAEAERRVDSLYKPYHAALSGELERARAAYGASVLIDAHSMPSRGAGGADIVIGDRYGRACAPAIIGEAERLLAGMGFVAVRNTPYAGGHTTERYGDPENGRHALQIEINRSLYMDERRLRPTPQYASLKAEITKFIKLFIAMDWAAQLAP